MSLVSLYNVTLYSHKENLFYSFLNYTMLMIRIYKRYVHTIIIVIPSTICLLLSLCMLLESSTYKYTKRGMLKTLTYPILSTNEGKEK